MESAQGIVWISRVCKSGERCLLWTRRKGDCHQRGKAGPVKLVIPISQFLLSHQELNENPGLVNESAMEDGWFIKLEVAEAVSLPRSIPW